MEKGAVIKHDLKKAPKTGDWGYMSPKVDKSRCSGCATCVPFCPEAAISMVKDPEAKNNKGEVSSFDYDFCKGCGVCSDVCPMKAITMQKK